MLRESCGFKGDKQKWKRFVKAVRNKNMMVWGVIEPIIDEYLEKEKE
jgi:hypothetical protein